jgi:nondiscriminating glutamyl-tRNA synthetase
VTDSRIRTRIAPSPTGPCHLGTARTALFNYLFAKGNGGTFIFRLEDTDRERSTPEFEQELCDSLRWLGLHWDEGPDVGGPAGPYRQSERGDVYRAAIDTLLETGHAYRCFCTPEALEAERKAQQARKELVHYAGTCRDLTAEEIESHLEAGDPFTVRFKMPDETFTFTDLVRGDVTVEGREVGDFIIAKRDGSPIFHLSNVVDDAEMGITHIMRGEDHLPNVPKHIALFRALDHKPPAYAHLPLILNPDGSKMGKRKMIEGLEPYVRVFRDRGYLPEALVNYLVLLGWAPGTEEEFFSLDELVSRFSVEAINKSGARFDLKKLDAFNGHYIRALPDDTLAEKLRPHFPGVAAESLRKVVALLRERLVTITDASRYNSMFFERLSGLSEYLYDDKKLQKYFARPEYVKYDPDYDASDLVLRRRHTARGSATMIRDVCEQLEGLPESKFTEKELDKAIRSVAEKYNWKDRHLFMVIRVAVTGKAASPPLFGTMEVIGKLRCLERLRFALEKLATKFDAMPWPKEAA